MDQRSANGQWTRNTKTLMLKTIFLMIRPWTLGHQLRGQLGPSNTLISKGRHVMSAILSISTRRTLEKDSTVKIQEHSHEKKPALHRSFTKSPCRGGLGHVGHICYFFNIQRVFLLSLEPFNKWQGVEVILWLCPGRFTRVWISTFSTGEYLWLTEPPKRPVDIHRE